MATKMASALFIWLLCVLPSFQIQPELKVDGNPYILVIYDFHKEIDTDGNCVGLSGRAMDSLLSLKWANEIINQNNNSNIGILVYDSCGSLRRAQKILGLHLNADLCENITKIAGVMTFTNKEIQSAVIDVIRPFGIFHSGISMNSHLTSASGLSFTPGGVSLWKIQGLIKMLEEFQWNYVNVFAVQNSVAETERQIFLKMATLSDICAYNIPDTNLSSALNSMSSSDSVVVFASDHEEIGGLLQAMRAYTDKQFILIGDSNIEFSSIRSNNTIFLREKVPPLQIFEEYLKKVVSNLTDVDAIILDFLNSLSYCHYNRTLNITTCNNGVIEYFIARSSDRTFSNTLFAYYNMHRTISNAATLKCANYDLTKCQLAVTFEEVHVVNNFVSGFSIQTVPLQHGLTVLEEVPVVFSTGLTPKIVLAEVTSDSISYINNSFSLPPSKCKETCQPCKACHKSKTDAQTILANDGDIILTASFPIYENSVFGQKCSKLSKEGVIMANSFLYAIDNVKGKYPTKNILPGVSIGALIFDTCSGRALQSFQPSSTSNCPETFINGQSKVTITGKLISNVYNLGSYQETPSDSMNADLAYFKVSPSGLSLASADYDLYLNPLMTILKAAHWTYVSIVYSEEFTKLESVTHVISNLRSNGICIYDETFIMKNEDSSVIASKFLNSTTVRGAVILFTTKADTNELLNGLRAKNFTFNGINMVFFAWNYGSDLPKGSLDIRPTKVMAPSLEHDTYRLSVIDNGYFRGPVTKEKNQWWFEYHENRHKCHVEKNENLIYPKSCTSHPTFSRNDSLDLTLSKLIVDSIDTVVTVTDSLYKSLCKDQTGMCEAFKSYNKFGTFIEKATSDYGFVEGSNRIQFTSDGTLKIPLEIVNKQRQSSEVKVGEVLENGTVTLFKDQVYAYDSTGNALTIEHQCPGWCSACHQCQTKTEQTISYHYKSGDINLLGMFPIHKMGSKGGMCGPLAFNNGTDYLIESFLYGINTARSRYPYILPGITLGSLTVDTCSGYEVPQQVVSNFESCFASFSSPTNQMVSPLSVPSYLLHGEYDTAKSLKSSLQRYGKYAMSHSTDYNNRETALGKLTYSFARSEVTTIVKFLAEIGWTYVSIVNSKDPEYVFKAGVFMEYAQTHNICVRTRLAISDAISMSEAVNSLDGNSDNVIILFLSLKDLRRFFSVKILNKVHVIGDTNISWNDSKSNIRIPLGSIVVDRLNKINEDLKSHLENAMTMKSSQYGNPWLSQFLKERENCGMAQTQSCNLPDDIMIQSSNIVMETDLMLHALNKRIVKVCGKNTGLCKNLENIRLSLDETDFENLDFMSEDTEVLLNGTNIQNGAFQINNFQLVNNMVKVGEWKNITLELFKARIEAYNNAGQKLNTLPLSRCVGSCVCINFNKTTEEPSTVEPLLDPETPFFLSSAKLINELWVFVVLAIACGGVLGSMLFVIYVIYKTCVGLLNKRYIGLGLLLLVGIISLYLSVLPFIFTPSEVVCASRYLVPEISYTIVYATCLTKLMSLMSYKLIGLGGELSNLNQFMTVSFITAVQVAIGVHHIALKSPFLEVMQFSNETMYACKFSRKDFILYLIYVMILIVMCALYAFTVRKEKKNMGEAIFILICSWANIVMWIAWVAVMLTITRDYVEPTICIGLLVCATTMILTIFVPKLHKIVKLKYDVKKSGVQNGGYKIDSEFMFERPHTLPGGFRSSYSVSPKKTVPKSLSTFDSSFSY